MINDLSTNNLTATYKNQFNQKCLFDLERSTYSRIIPYIVVSPLYNFCFNSRIMLASFLSV